MYPEWSTLAALSCHAALAMIGHKRSDAAISQECHCALVAIVYNGCFMGYIDRTTYDES